MVRVVHIVDQNKAAQSWKKIKCIVGHAKGGLRPFILAPSRKIGAWHSDDPFLLFVASLSPKC